MISFSCIPYDCKRILKETDEIINLAGYGPTALTGWNGEIYSDCYRCDDLGAAIDADEKFSLRPVVEQIPDSDDFKTVGYELA